MIKIGVLHPGEMGVSIAAAATNSGNQVYWTSENRNSKTHLRSEKYGLLDASSLSQLTQNSDIIFSVCPPHSAEEVAKSVIDQGFKGYYLDANAISPQRTIKIGNMMESNGIHFIDGGIIGGPAWNPKETWLYLSGKDAKAIADCFSNGPLETKIIGDEIGKASALKMCYAAYSKGTTALLADDSGFSEQTNRRVTRVTAKAWRFEGEMHEIASTFQEAGLPNGFHEAAAEIYRHLAGFKDSTETPSLDDVLNTLRK